MTRKILLGVFSTIFSLSLFAQTPPATLTGSALRTWLKRNTFDGQHTQLGYSEARRRMYNFIDNQNNSIEGVYSGFRRSWRAGGTGTNPMPINAEHTVPQSFFGRSEPMRSDIHHLFPTFNNWNSERSNHKFAEITDSRTTKWIISDRSQSSIPRSNRDGYSESNGSVFEPRESQKGNTARAIFYFYTMYPSQAGAITRVGDLSTLYQWHLDDPVDARERARNSAIAQYQGNRNPYIDTPSLVARAWGFSGGTPTPTPAPTTNAGIYISEYVEGSSFNKALEIANQSGRSVSLSGYSLRKQTNGAGSWGSSYTLSGSLRSGDVLVIANSSASSEVRSRADRTTSSTVLNFNGNDPIGLFSGDQLIDVVGRFNGGSTDFAKDQTLIRKRSIRQGSSTYRAGEWNAYVQDTFAALGSLTLGAKQEASSVQSLLLEDSDTGRLQLDFFGTKNVLYIQSDSQESENISLQIFTTQGTKIIDTVVHLSEGRGELPVSLASGIYIIKVQNGLQTYTRKMAF